VSDIDIAVVDSLKALDLKWPIREADMRCQRKRSPNSAGRSSGATLGPSPIR
jgi:hypothetical protein